MIRNSSPRVRLDHKWREVALKPSVSHCLARKQHVLHQTPKKLSEYLQELRATKFFVICRIYRDELDLFSNSKTKRPFGSGCFHGYKGTWANFIDKCNGLT